jgi:hypothetical protein
MTKKHLIHYLSLFAILTFSVFGFYLFSYDRQIQMAIMISAGVAYVVWGAVHHKMHGDLKFAVLLEYLIFAFLGVLIVASMILRG